MVVLEDMDIHFHVVIDDEDNEGKYMVLLMKVVAEVSNDDMENDDVTPLGDEVEAAVVVEHQLKESMEKSE